MYAREIREIDDLPAFAADGRRVAEARQQIRLGDVYIARRAYPSGLLRTIREYLVQVGRGSLPNYQRIEPNAPNFHRLNRQDERAYVQGCFHQFVFFPWNQDVFNLFTLFRAVYAAKNVLSGLPAEKFLGREPQDGCTARIAFQFYPRGAGRLNRHVDPVDHHQLTVPIMQMSRKGEDFSAGGLYVVRDGGERLNLDDLTDWGDVIYFNAQCPHGVDPIDPGAEPDWVGFQGRWMLLFAVNRLFDNRTVGNSVDLGKP